MAQRKGRRPDGPQRTGNEPSKWAPNEDGSVDAPAEPTSVESAVEPVLRDRRYPYGNGGLEALTLTPAFDELPTSSDYPGFAGAVADEQAESAEGPARERKAVSRKKRSKHEHGTTTARAGGGKHQRTLATLVPFGDDMYLEAGNNGTWSFVEVTDLLIPPSGTWSTASVMSIVLGRVLLRWAVGLLFMLIGVAMIVAGDDVFTNSGEYGGKTMGLALLIGSGYLVMASAFNPRMRSIRRGKAQPEQVRDSLIRSRRQLMVGMILIIVASFTVLGSAFFYLVSAHRSFLPALGAAGLLLPAVVFVVTRMGVVHPHVESAAGLAPPDDAGARRPSRARVADLSSIARWRLVSSGAGGETVWTDILTGAEYSRRPRSSRRELFTLITVVEMLLPVTVLVATAVVFSPLGLMYEAGRGGTFVRVALSLPSWVMFSAFLFGRRLALVPMRTDAPVEQRRPKPPSWTVVPALAVLVLTVLATVAVGDQTLSTAPTQAIGAWLLLFAAPVPAFVTWNFAARLYWLRTRG